MHLLMRTLAILFSALVVAGGSSQAANSRTRDLDESYVSHALNGALHFDVFLPDGYDATQQRYPVIYVLHGLPAGSDSYRNSSFVAEAVRRIHGNAIVVAPQGARDDDSDPEYRDWGDGRERVRERPSTRAEVAARVSCASDVLRLLRRRQGLLRRRERPPASRAGACWRVAHVSRVSRRPPARLVAVRGTALARARARAPRALAMLAARGDQATALVILASIVIPLVVLGGLCLFFWVHRRDE